MSNLLLKYDIDYDLSQKISIDELLNYEILPLIKKGFFILVATNNMDQDIKKLNNIFKNPVKLLYVDKKYLEWEYRYLHIKKELFSLANQSIQNTTHIQKQNSSIIQFIDHIIMSAIEQKSSDIHIESFKDHLMVRYRIDGVLVQFFRFSIKLFDSISSVLKYFSSLDISQKRIPLNGRFTKEYFEQEFDFRISTIPSIYNESIVIRILDNMNQRDNLDSIGLDHFTKQSLKIHLKSQQGLILITGPTGSGKTTTLYASLTQLDSVQKKIITIEDPVEYKLDNVVQVNIDPQIDLDYPVVLKNVLRQDPDVLMIGEIRDVTSLQIALRAALTGHLVLASLHTNSAIETISRLLDLGAPPYLIASTLKLVVSQGLVRRLCNSCKEFDKKIKGYRAIGCPHCHFTGYSGRQVVSEALNIDPQIAKMIEKNSDQSDLVEQVKTTGHQTLSEVAMKLIENGITTREELISKVSSEI